MSLKKKSVYDLVGNIIGVHVPSKEIEVMMTSKGNADHIIAKHHYSGKPTKNCFVSMLVYWKGDVHGAIQIGYGIRPKIKGDRNPDEVREFDRMWLSDDMPKFSETIVLSCVHKFIRGRFPDVKILISYADTSVDNPGTIYRAANYTEEKRVKCDFYILPSGERVHPVSMWHRHGTRAWAFLQNEYPGIKKAVGEQIRFSIAL